MNKHYSLIARAVERLDKSNAEARRAVYERARTAVAQLRSNQPALLDADITKECLVLEEAIRQVEAEAARNSLRETRAEPRSPVPSEGTSDVEKIQSGQVASPDQDDPPQALSSRQAPIFLPAASDDRHKTDIQAVAIGGAYGADHYYDDILSSRSRGGLLVVTAMLALAALAGTFAYRAMFRGDVFLALQSIVKTGPAPDNIVGNNSDSQLSNSSQTFIASAGSSEELQPIDTRESPKSVPRVISTIPISSKPSADAVASAPDTPAPEPAVVDPHVAPSAPLASTPVLPASSEATETAAVAPAAREDGAPSPASAAPVLTAASVPLLASAPVAVLASSEPTETAAVAPATREEGAPSPASAAPLLTVASVPPPAAAPMPAQASSDPKKVQLVNVDPDEWSETDTSSPPAANAATPAAASAAAAPLVGNNDDAAPSSGSSMQAGRDTGAEVSSGGAYAVQLASEHSAAEAHASFRALRAKFQNQLGGREPIVRRADLGAKGIYYRVMVGPFASMEKAAGICTTLKAAGCKCLVQRI